jgi:hypothetical protein
MLDLVQYSVMSINGIVRIKEEMSLTKLRDKFLSVRQFSEITGMKIPKILKEIKKGKIRAVKIDWYWLISRKEVERLKE